MSKQIWILIAAYNEAKNIKGVVNNLQKHGYHNIIVVDDASKDSTYKILQTLPVVSLHHVINRGQGAALRTGTQYFLKHTKGKYLVHFDADGQHRPQDIPAMVKPLNEVQVTTGSRFLSKQALEKVPQSKQFILQAGVLFNRIMYNVKATDAHNGFRAMTREAAARIDFIEDRMEHASEIAAIIANKKIPHKEVSVVIEYHEYGQNIFHGMRMFTRLVFKKLIG